MAKGLLRSLRRLFHSSATVPLKVNSLVKVFLSESADTRAERPDSGFDIQINLTYFGKDAFLALKRVSVRAGHGAAQASTWPFGEAFAFSETTSRFRSYFQTSALKTETTCTKPLISWGPVTCTRGHSSMSASCRKRNAVTGSPRKANLLTSPLTCFSATQGVWGNSKIWKEVGCAMLSRHKCNLYLRTRLLTKGSH